MIWAESWLSYLPSGRVCPSQGPAWSSVRARKSAPQLALTGSMVPIQRQIQEEPLDSLLSPARRQAMEILAQLRYPRPLSSKLCPFSHACPLQAFLSPPAHSPVEHVTSTPVAHTPASPVDLIPGDLPKSGVPFPTLYPRALPHSTPVILSLPVKPSLS